MSLVAVISDIHGNLHALKAVLAEIKSMGIKDIICLGDIVGYGPAPRECIDLVTKHCDHIVLGNHDEAAFNPAAAHNFNGIARTAIVWTNKELMERHHQTLQLLPEISYFNDDIMCVHDCPAPAPTDYIYDAYIAAIAFRGVDTRVCLVGHTHVPAVFEVASPNVEDKLSPQQIYTYNPLNEEGVVLYEDHRYICNPGSVGQPRDNDPRASFGMLDLDEWMFSIHRVEYDVNAAQAATHKAGLPGILAERLAMGA